MGLNCFHAQNLIKNLEVLCNEFAKLHISRKLWIVATRGIVYCLKHRSWEVRFAKVAHYFFFHTTIRAIFILQQLLQLTATQCWCVGVGNEVWLRWFWNCRQAWKRRVWQRNFVVLSGALRTNSETGTFGSYHTDDP